MQSLPAPSSLRDAFLAVPELEKVTAGFGMLVPFLSQEQNSFRDVSEFQELCCRKGEQCFWIGKMESLSCFSHPAFAKGYPRGPRAGFQQPQHSGSRAENGVLWAKTPESLRTVTFSRGFFILGYPRKAVMLVIGVSKLPSVCRHHDDGV